MNRNSEVDRQILEVIDANDDGATVTEFNQVGITAYDFTMGTRRLLDANVIEEKPYLTAIPKYVRRKKDK